MGLRLRLRSEYFSMVDFAVGDMEFSGSAYMHFLVGTLSSARKVRWASD